MNEKIPPYIFQTWHSLELPIEMKTTSQALSAQNPDFEYYLYDDSMCYDFISKHFNPDVLDAFNSLKPGAYKADLWRYCVLYKYGGIYLDIKFKGVNGFRLESLRDKEHYVSDPSFNYIYTGLMVFYPESIHLKHAIDCIVQHKQYRFYGLTPFDPTGPSLFQTLLIDSNLILNVEWSPELRPCKMLIYQDDTLILETYGNYLKEQQTHEKMPHYSKLWADKNIYEEI